MSKVTSTQPKIVQMMERDHNLMVLYEDGEIWERVRNFMGVSLAWSWVKIDTGRYSPLDKPNKKL